MENPENSDSPIPLHNSDRTRKAGGLLLILLGAYLLLHNLRIFDIQLWRILSIWWPLILIHFGIMQAIRDKSGLRTAWYIALVAILAYIIISTLG